MEENYDVYSDPAHMFSRIGAVAHGADNRPTSIRGRGIFSGGRYAREDVVTSASGNLMSDEGSMARQERVFRPTPHASQGWGNSTLSPRPNKKRSTGEAECESVTEGSQARAVRHPDIIIQGAVEAEFSSSTSDGMHLTNTTISGRAVSSREVAIASLKAKGFSSGLARHLAANALAFANRIWVVDNSGSMVIADGHRMILAPDGKISQQRVSRWEELQDTVMYHAEIAGTLNSPTVFRLLNDPGPHIGPQEMAVAQGPVGTCNLQEEIRTIQQVMQRTEPLGMTPLTTHILQIQRAIHQIAPRLRREGQRVAVILATDGLPTDTEGFGGEEITEEFVQALKSMEGLPVWLVIRLCTDEEKVTEFYNALDARFELSMEVLDDYLGEAREVHRHNKWLNYSLPLHRCRELGYHDRLFDLIDERPLTKGELRDFSALLFGYEVQQIPDPNFDWTDFISFVQGSVATEPKQYDPMKKKVLPLIHVRVLNRSYGQKRCTIM